MFIKYEEQTWKAFKWTTLLLSFMNPHLKNCIPLIAINFHAVCSFLQFYFRSKNARLWYLGISFLIFLFYLFFLFFFCHGPVESTILS